MNTNMFRWAPIAALSLSAAACASVPESASERIALIGESEKALAMMEQKDPSLEDVLDDAEAYAVFPTVGEGAFIAGATLGDGVVYSGEEVMGYVQLAEGSIGAQIGGQEYSQLIVFQTDDSVQRLKAGNFDFSADASATAVTSGAAVKANAESGVLVLVDDEDGLMAEASVGGQRIYYEAR